MKIHLIKPYSEVKNTAAACAAEIPAVLMVSVELFVSWVCSKMWLPPFSMMIV
jgi:hypothetical protein